MVPDKSHSLVSVRSKEDEFHSSSNNNSTVSHEIPSAQDRASHEDLNQTLQQVPSKAAEIVKGRPCVIYNRLAYLESRRKWHHWFYKLLLHKF